ncbi:Copper acquisition factor BIM1-like domain-containing protein [Madurella fahalii]|uniref:Copper acquisition factor BIM1-like domain-containing protein n=1 Tax=Madurella fahalii TaxID=1157608 RepID=A0ABQ0FWQ0_9PEZI
MTLAALMLFTGIQLAHAHFAIDYPAPRAVTLGPGRNESYSQWENPCAGVPGNLPNGNRTDWPIAGGSLKLDLRHPWTYIFVNLGLGADVSNFNYTLTKPFWNSTGNGTLCVSQLTLPAELPISDGSQGSLQVVTVGDDGNALYNCADITFTANAAPLSAEECVTSPGVSFTVVEAQNGDGTSGGSANGVNPAGMWLVAALTTMFVFGIGL